MPESNQPTPTADATPTPKPSWNNRLAQLPAVLVHLAVKSRFHAIVTGALALSFLAAVFAVWSYLAHLAVDHDDSVTLDMAYKAFDEGNYLKARDMIGRLQNETEESLSFGGALFILGVVKARQAGEEWSADRSRAIHIVASRYLQKALAIGLPPEREATAKYELGRSLILGNQSRAGIEVFEKIVDLPEELAAEMHTLLVQAYLDSPNPQLEKSFEHTTYALQDNTGDSRLREQAKRTQAEILLRLGRLDAAQTVIESLAETEGSKAERELLLGRLAIQQAAQFKENDPRQRDQLLQAIDTLREAQRVDAASGEVTRRAMYEIAVALKASGQIEAALDQFDRVSKLFGDTPVGLAATLAEADLERLLGKNKQSLASYRTALEAVGDPATYLNSLLSLDQLRKRLLTAFQAFIDNNRFEESLMLIAQFEPVFNHLEWVELRAKTEEKWGEYLVDEATRDDRWHARVTRKQARRRLRAAGRAYEDLARMRYATRFFTDDLWIAADCYYRGQNYTNAARLLKEYLHHEVRRRNSLALLRLGQSHLARRRPEAAIEALQECIQMYPRDAVVYQARLESAQAYQQIEKSAEAEAMLRANLTGDELTPTSPEWRDSLFAFGNLLYELQQYDSSISNLQQAVERYPSDEKTLMALYTIARAHHRATEAPKERLRLAKTEAERQQHRKLLNEELEQAHQAYVEVQRMITLEGYGDSDPLHRTLQRNCYMMQGSVLFDLKKFEEARQAYANVSTLYQNEPFVLESFVKIANCFRRMNQPLKARGTLMQAKQVLDRLPPDVDFRISTNFTRQQWSLVLNQMSQW